MTISRAMDWEACTIEPQPNREVARVLRRELGEVPPWLPYVSACPWIARAMGSNLADGLLVAIDGDLCERIWLAVSQDNSCRYCYASHRALMRMLGVAEPRVRAIEQDLFTAELDDREKLALDFARRCSRSNPLPNGADKQPLREAGYNDDAIKEIAFTASYISACNRVATLLALPPEPVEQLPERWLNRIARPWIGRRLGARRRPGKREALRPEDTRGAYSYLVAALGELPLARLLRGQIDVALDSPVLSRRAKLLVFAVIARGLACELSEREATKLLADEGFDSDRVGTTLSHLAAAELDSVEALAVPFARETIRYRTGAIQRRAQEVAANLAPAEFLELVGVAALANMVGRLAIVVDLP
jgi:uncharacterized peroxidase-related enzyme